VTDTLLMKSLNHLALIVILCCLSACNPQQSKSSEQQFVEKVTSQFILPWHQNFSNASKALLQSSNTFCTNTNDNNFEQTRTHWFAAMSDWQRVQLFHFGPILSDNQRWKIQFWPDSHNLIRKKTDSILEEQQPITVERIKGASAVLQGLSAIEYLLFDAQAGQIERFSDQNKQCELLIAIAAHTSEVSTNLWVNWADYAQDFTAPSDSNGLYPTIDASLSALVDTMLASLEIGKKDKLSTPLGLNNKALRPRPFLQEAWRSNYSTQAIIINLQGIESLYRSGLDRTLSNKPDGLAISNQINDAFQTINTLNSSLNTSMNDALKSDNDKAQLLELHQQVTELTRLIKHDVPRVLGISLGFNANDGD